jgi:lipid-A-disaccharide synthase-like uncharacterized protein
MHQTLIEFFGIRITGWKMIGYAGVFLFSARWFVQLWALREAKKPVLPAVFWVMSLVGSLLSLAYFVFGKNDSVGILAYVFPSIVSVYNLRLEFAQKRRLRNIGDSESSNQPVQRTGASRSVYEPNRTSSAAGSRR